MMNKKKNFLIKFIFSQSGLVILGIILLFIIGAPLIRNIEKRNKINQEIKEMEKELAMAENRNNELKKILEYFQSDQFLEEQARLKFNLKKTDENVAIIKDIENNKSDNKIKNIYIIPEKKEDKYFSNPIKWLKYFTEKK